MKASEKYRKIEFWLDFSFVKLCENLVSLCETAFWAYFTKTHK